MTVLNTRAPAVLINELFIFAVIIFTALPHMKAFSLHGKQYDGTRSQVIMVSIQIQLLIKVGSMAFFNFGTEHCIYVALAGALQSRRYRGDGGNLTKCIFSRCRQKMVQ